MDKKIISHQIAIRIAIVLLFASLFACSKPPIEEKNSNLSTEQMYVLGMRHVEAVGVEQDYEEAFKLLERAAKEGHPMAQQMLGDLYRFGFGVDEDGEQAIYWYKLAAEQGLGSASLYLSKMYSFFGTDLYDEGLERKWLERSSSQGIGKASLYLSFEHSMGSIEGRKWLGLAAEQGDTYALYELWLDRQYEATNELEHNLAFQLLKESASNGFDRAQYELASYYLAGTAPAEKSYQRAAVLFESAEKQGHPGARFQLGLLYEHGLGVLQDYVKAYFWYNLNSLSTNELSGSGQEARDRLAKSMTPEQIAEAQSMGRTWLTCKRKEKEIVLIRERPPSQC